MKHKDRPVWTPQQVKRSLFCPFSIIWPFLSEDLTFLMPCENITAAVQHSEFKIAEDRNIHYPVWKHFVSKLWRVTSVLLNLYPIFVSVYLSN